MKLIVKKFLDEPVVVLGLLSVVATVLVSEGVLSGPVAAVAVAVLTFLQRQLVTPEYE